MRTVVSHLWLSSQGLNGARPVPCAFSLSNRRNRQYTAPFSLNFTDRPIIYSIYSYFLLKSQSSIDPEVLLLCSCFFFLWIPISVCLHLPSSESLKLHAISQAAWLPNGKRSCLGFKKKISLFRKQWTHSSIYWKSYHNSPFYLWACLFLS